MAAALYSYIGLSGEVVVIDTSNLVFTGAWSNSTSYAVKDVVDYNLRKFICVAAHTGVTPPTIFTTGIPEYWSPLVLIEGGSDDGITPDEAYSLAYLALQTAWAGTAAADAALQVALTGTAAADQAYSLAQQALEAAWAGTNLPALDSVYSLAQTALNTAWAGTDAANSADMWGRTAYSLAVDGTNAAASAYSLAQTAYNLITSGTDASAAIARADAAMVVAEKAIFEAGTAAQGADMAWSYAGMAYTLATTGTQTASGAMGLANQAAIDAGVAQATADFALNVAWAGTTAADAAYTLADQANFLATKAIFEAGTAADAAAAADLNAGNAQTQADTALAEALYATGRAISLTTQAGTAADRLTSLEASTAAALPLAGGVMTGTFTTPNVQVGYGTLPTSSMSSGTQYYNFVGAAYQETTVDRDMFISAQNMDAGREIAVVLRNNGTSHTLAYSGSFEWFGSAPPATITTKDVVLAFTSSGNTLGGVMAAAQTAV